VGVSVFKPEDWIFLIFCVCKSWGLKRVNIRPPGGQKWDSRGMLWLCISWMCKCTVPSINLQDVGVANFNQFLQG